MGAEVVDLAACGLDPPLLTLRTGRVSVLGLGDDQDWRRLVAGSMNQYTVQSI